MNAFEILPRDVDLGDFLVVIDVRPGAVERAALPGARPVGIDELLEHPDRFIPALDAAALIVCDIGVRSGRTAAQLAARGYTNATSLAGGVDAWRRDGRPLEHTAGLSPTQLERYDRQIKLPELGIAAQRRLTDARVTVVGAGGLGLPAITYLAAGGIGTIRVIDPDVVELSNLHRQPLFEPSTVGQVKVDEVKRFVERFDPDLEVEAIEAAIDPQNAAELLAGSDVIIDATDRFDARYAISDAGVEIDVPVVTGAVYRWEGQITTLDNRGPCYRCIFPDPPGSDVALDCALTGVMGSVVGTIGTMQATEAIRIITTGSAALTGTLVVMNAFDATFDRVRISKRPDCEVCGAI